MYGALSSPHGLSSQKYDPMRTSTYLFESLDVLRDGLSFVTEQERNVVEISWNTEGLGIPLNVLITFTYEIKGADSEHFIDPKPEQIGVLKIDRLSKAKEFHHQVQYSACAQLISERFDVHHQDLKPRMIWRHKEWIWRVILSHKDSSSMSGIRREARLWIAGDTSYYDALTGLKLAHEKEIRARALEGINQIALVQSLTTRAHLPAVSAYWMSEYHYKRLMRLPTHQDLIGYEYEAKLSVDHIQIDELPNELLEDFEIIERYQTESIRWYLKNVTLSGIGKVKKGRVGFRGPRASLVSKGKKQKLEGGILKRSEEKSQGLNTWELGQIARDAKEMRRIKRQLYVRSKQSNRIYALCLDYCYVEGSARAPLLQIELEYNGTLLIDPNEWTLDLEKQLEWAEHFKKSAPKIALRCLERAEWLFNRQQPDEALQKQYEELQSDIQASLSAEPVEDTINQKLEEAVLLEMRAILNGLRRAYGYKATSKTKREWLKDELKTIDLEPLF